jgi:hypothetical protein
MLDVSTRFFSFGLDAGNDFNGCGGFASGSGLDIVVGFVPSPSLGRLGNEGNPFSNSLSPTVQNSHISFHECPFGFS